MCQKCIQNRHDEGLKSDLGLSRGGQAVSESLNASILKRFSSLFVLCLVLLHVVFARKVLCIMVAASHCNCFSRCVERGRGSAAGAAEDHMTCMLDGLQTMGQNMIAAKSTTWNYLKRAVDNDLTLERASRSLAKTGSFLVLFWCLFCVVF